MRTFFFVFLAFRRPGFLWCTTVYLVQPSTKKPGRSSSKRPKPRKPGSARISSLRRRQSRANATEKGTGRPTAKEIAMTRMGGTRVGGTRVDGNSVVWQFSTFVFDVTMMCLDYAGLLGCCCASLFFIIMVWLFGNMVIMSFSVDQDQARCEGTTPSRSLDIKSSSRID